MCATREFYEGRLGEVFVDVTVQRAPVTLFIIMRYFESPASTFRLVNHIRLAAISVTVATRGFIKKIKKFYLKSLIDFQKLYLKINKAFILILEKSNLLKIHIDKLLKG